MGYPRRVRRRLLLPPGWVALGFLLLLGCLAFVSHWRQLRQNNVVQITMPPLQAGNLSLWPGQFYQSPEQLEKYRPWHTVDFKGELIADFFGAAAIKAATRQILADTSHAGGVRIRFWPGATYANLVSTLDIMNYIGQKKYWLDIRHFPTTLYAITDPSVRTNKYKAPVFWGCCTCGDYTVKPVADAAWLPKFQSLWWKPWRPITLLIVLISTLSFWQLFRPKINRTYS